MVESSVSPAPLSSRFEDWFKSQPEAQRLVGIPQSGQNHHVQQAGRVYGARGTNYLVPPLRYDFDSKYSIENRSSSRNQDADLSSLLNRDSMGRVRAGNHSSPQGIRPKATTILGIGPPVVRHPTPTNSDEQPHAITLTDPPKNTTSLIDPLDRPLCESQDQESDNPAIPKKKSWISSHAKTILALSILLQSGVVSLTISLVLCTQDSKRGHVRDGTVITGVVGLASIMCGVITGYDMLVAEYSGTRHEPTKNSEQKINEITLSGGTLRLEKDGRLLRNFSEKESLNKVDCGPKPKHKITTTHLPHNTIYSSRLSIPFSPSIPPEHIELPSSTSPHARPGEVYRQIRESRRLTPQSPLPIPISHPPRDTMIRWSPALDNRYSAQDTETATLVVPETWAQRLERGVRPRSSATPRLPDVEEIEEPSSAHPVDLDIDAECGPSRVASRIISLYSSLDSVGDEYQRESLPSLGMSPLTPGADHEHSSCSFPEEEDIVSPLTPDTDGKHTSCTFPAEVVIRVSTASSRNPKPQDKRESNELLRLWHQYIAESEGSSPPSSRMTVASTAHQSRQLTVPDRWRVVSWPPSPGSRDGRSDGERSRRDTAWSRVFSTLNGQHGEGGLHFSGV